MPAGTVLSVYSGPLKISASNTVLADRIINGSVDVTGTDVTIKDSMINGTVVNDGAGTLLIEDTRINGGSAALPVVGYSDLKLLRDNISGGMHEVSCSSGNCVVENSWLHDNYNGSALGWHQNGFFTDGYSNYTLEHNSVYCVGNCTADIAFIPNSNISEATVSQNLFVGTTSAGYCLDPSSDSPAKSGIINRMTIINNVFQRGPTGKCGVYGPVYGWDTPNNKPGADGYGNVWSGNMWDNGETLEES